MEPQLIRILHLSDFHVGKDDHGQRVLLEELLDHLRERASAGQGPDLVVITGDIADKGQAAHYQVFKQQFLVPLLEYVPKGRLFVVPGNHDVDRDEARSTHRYDILETCPNFFDPTTKGLKQRKASHPRFQAFVDELGSLAAVDWVISEPGTHAEVISIGGIRLGILGLNTAWLSGGDGEQRKLRLGKEMVRNGLKQVEAADQVIVLGHHPLDWLHASDASKLGTLFAKIKVVFLGGHIHKGDGRSIEGAGEYFLALHAGAAFQARESDVWVNGFQWYEYQPEAGAWLVEPFVWHAEHDEWRLDHHPFPNKRRVPGQDRWLFDVNRIGHNGDGEGSGKSKPTPFRVLVLATDRDLGQTRDETVTYLTQILGMEAVAGSADGLPDPGGFDLVILMQAWQWAAGTSAEVWEKAGVEKRLWIVDEEADWPPRRLVETGAVPEIEAFRKKHHEAHEYEFPGELPRLIGEEAGRIRRHRQPADEPEAGLSAAERAYLGLRLPTWKDGRTAAGKGFKGIEQIYGERAYVPLDGYSSRWMLDDNGKLVPAEAKAGKSGKAIEQAARGGLRRPLAWWVSRPQLPRLVISGSPGAGKTVFLTRIAAALGEFLLGGSAVLEAHLEPDGLRSNSQYPVPVTLEATGLAARQPQGFADLVAAVHGELFRAGCEETPDLEQVEKGLRLGRYLLLIDALDEVAHDAARNDLLLWLQGLHGQLKMARIVLTTRSARYTGELAFGHAFEILDLTDLSREQITAMCERFRALKGESADFLARLEKALDEVANRAGTEEANLLANPLLLGTACTVFHKLNRLPNDRAELCFQIVEHLCRSRVSQSDDKKWSLHPEEKRDLLERLALAMQEETAQEWPLCRAYDVVAEGLAEGARERDRVAQYVKWLVEQTGLLYIQAGTEGETLRFHHRLFREYLAACRLIKDNLPIEEILARLWEKKQLIDPAWLDVVRLVPGALNNIDKSRAMGAYLTDLAEKHVRQRGRLLAVLVASIVENQSLFRLFDTAGTVAKTLETYEKEGKGWDTPTRVLLLESIGWLGDPRPDPRLEKYWAHFKPGPFTMGDRQALGSETPHTEKIVEDFRLARFAVTNQEYRAFMEADGYTKRQYWSDEGWAWLQLKGVAFDEWFAEKEKKYEKEYIMSDAKYYRPDIHPLLWKNPGFNSPNQPVVGIRWHEAEAYCRWLSDKLAMDPPSWWREDWPPEVVLPVEAEWEYAARGAKGRPFPWDDDCGPDPEHANYRESKLEGATPVGCYPRGATPEGLCDMAGNVWEWCRGVWAREAREGRQKGERNPENTDGDPGGRVLRGGSWFYDADYLRSAYRNWNLVWSRFSSIGFRCCLRVCRRPEHG